MGCEFCKDAFPEPRPMSATYSELEKAEESQMRRVFEKYDEEFKKDDVEVLDLPD